MLLLLLLHHRAAIARSPLAQHNFDNEYGYIEAYPGDLGNQLEHGSDYNDDDDDYEYIDEDEFRSGGVDFEVNKKVKLSRTSRNASVAKMTLKVLTMPHGLLAARRANLTSIRGRQTHSSCLES